MVKNRRIELGPSVIHACTDESDPAELAAQFGEALSQGRIALLKTGEHAEDGGAMLAKVLDALPDAISTASYRFELECRRPHLLRNEGCKEPLQILPHHDSGSRTWLVGPSESDQLPPGPRHAYTGFIVNSVGREPSATQYWDLVSLLESSLSIGDQPVSCRVLQNLLRKRLSDRERTANSNGLRLTYVTLASLLGCNGASAVAIEGFESSTPLSSFSGIPVSEIRMLRRPCPCGLCLGETATATCHLIHRISGTSLWTLGSKYGESVVAERGDLVMWNNVFLQHGNSRISVGRTISHRYLTVSEPGEFKAWLHTEWNRRCSSGEML